MRGPPDRPVQAWPGQHCLVPPTFLPRGMQVPPPDFHACTPRTGSETNQVCAQTRLCVPISLKWMQCGQELKSDKRSKV